MKLVDLNPRWLGAGGEGIYNADGSPAEKREGVAILFNCPCGCEAGICINIDPPLDGGPPLTDENHVWKRTGDTFETLTLTPSIQRIGGCAWHGFVTAGEVKPA